MLAGAAAQWWPHLNGAHGIVAELIGAGYTYWVNAFGNPVNGSGYLNTTQYASIYSYVNASCDKLDGVADGIIDNR